MARVFSKPVKSTNQSTSSSSALLGLISDDIIVPFPIPFNTSSHRSKCSYSSNSDFDNGLSRNASLSGLNNILPPRLWYCMTTCAWPIPPLSLIAKDASTSFPVVSVSFVVFNTCALTIKNGLAMGPTTRSTAKTLITRQWVRILSGWVWIWRASLAAHSISHS